MAFALLIGAVAVLAVTGWHALFVAAEAAAAALIGVRAVTVPRNRRVWALAAVGIGQWVAGGIALDLGWDAVAGVLFAGMFACEFLGLSLFLHGRIRPFPVWLAVDGVLAAFTLAALGALAYGPLRGATHSEPHIVAGLLANIVCDLVLLALVLVGFAATSWRPGRAWLFAGIGLVVTSTGDMLVVFGETTGPLVQVLWATALIFIALASWQPTPTPTATRVGWSTAALPLGAGAVAIAVALYCGIASGEPVAAFMAAGALLAALARAVLMLRENLGLLHSARREALTDKLTGLPNRRALLLQLDRAIAGQRPHTLAFFDLDGFKAYNDDFGHAAGDALLQRLAPRLAMVGGRAFRLGGDEFCLLLPHALGDDAPRVARAVAALGERGEGFQITASHGLVLIPEEAGRVEDALRLADERMYARKRHRRAGQAEQARAVLVALLDERGEDEARAAALAGEFGRRLGLADPAADVSAAYVAG
ncbi:GGDEF domain-containing protein [Solirubrobacter pauli]|uniref:GGDEF domain-containing protein n=1 Tax=Solirubrobacter pauli TaxID=166793 RepID=UPI001B87102E|nr:GGDEF domain-containing protein [Solirubrobacter pauli]